MKALLVLALVASPVFSAQVVPQPFEVPAECIFSATHGTCVVRNKQLVPMVCDASITMTTDQSQSSGTKQLVIRGKMYDDTLQVKPRVGEIITKVTAEATCSTAEPGVDY